MFGYFWFCKLRARNLLRAAALFGPDLVLQEENAHHKRLVEQNGAPIVRTLVLQSFRTEDVPAWIHRCLDSVQIWTAQRRFEYQFVGDELFDVLPEDYRRKVAGRLPIAADLARLLWLQRYLAGQPYTRAVWVDADVLIFAPQALDLRMSESCMFGYEHWLQQTQRRYRVSKNVHNAFMAFRRDCPVLPFLIQTTQRLVQRMDAAKMPPQFVGPKLLTSLHNTVSFDVDARVGAISPDLHHAVLEDDHTALRVYRQSQPPVMLAANLCLSVADGAQMDVLIDHLAARGDGLMI